MEGVPSGAPDIIVTHASGETITDRDGRQIALLTTQEDLTVTAYHLADGEQGPEPPGQGLAADSPCAGTPPGA